MTQRLLLLLLVFTLPLQSLVAQKGKDKKEEEEKKWLEDPYSENDKDVLKAAGILNTGRFHWADNHSTSDIDEALGGARIRWIETEHFLIGSSLDSYVVDKGSKIEKAKIKEELARLRERLPEAPKKAKKLDPWLRLHLYAMRAEDLYAEIEDLLGVTDGDFPTGPGQTKDGRYMGEGPYLGMKSKFTILLVDQQSSLGRYRSAFMNTEGDDPIRYMFPRDGTLMFGVATENDGMTSDTTMHCLFVYSMTMNLLNGYRYYRHALPEWVNTGIGHYYARQIDPSKNYFTKDRLFGSDDKNIWKWEPKVRARVGHEYYPSFEDVMGYLDPENMKYSEHMIAWSRVDYLMDQKREGFALWFDRLKDPYEAGVQQTPESLHERQIVALQEAFGLDSTTFDAQWAEWALDHYPKK
jgi:hypothetical protein